MVLVLFGFELRVKMELCEDVLEKLKCCECSEYLSCEPVMLKSNGDSVCGRCYVTDDLKLARNKVYEIVSSTILFPCRYNKDGCTKKFKIDDMKKHEEECQYYRYNCPVQPLGSCLWRGPITSLLEHFRNEHSECIVEHPYKFQPEYNESYDKNILMIAYGFLFLIQMKFRKNFDKISFNIRFIGTPSLSNLFLYKLEITNGVDSLIKTRNVQTHNKLNSTQTNNLNINIKNVKEELNDHTKIWFSINIVMNDVNCLNCKQLLIQSPIYKTDNGYRCENCSIIKYKYCKNFENGCTFKDNELNLNKHEKWLCVYASTVCTKCRTVLKDTNLLEHEMDKHTNFKIDNSFMQLEKIFANQQYRAVVNCHDVKFYCIWKLGVDSFDFDIVSNLNDKFDNKKFKCEVIVNNPNDVSKIIKEQVCIDDLNEYYFDWDLTIKKDEFNYLIDDEKCYNLLFKISSINVL